MKLVDKWDSEPLSILLWSEQISGFDQVEVYQGVLKIQLLAQILPFTIFLYFNKPESEAYLLNIDLCSSMSLWKVGCSLHYSFFF